MDSLQKELVLNDKSFLVSQTDEKGIIKFANDEFCQYSEYSLEELIGKPHSMVRHPDMPKGAFADLWKTVQSGDRWRGFVKNSTKVGNTIGYLLLFFLFCLQMVQGDIYLVEERLLEKR